MRSIVYNLSTMTQIMKIKLFTVIAISLVLSVSCNRTNKYEEEEAALIQEYLDSHSNQAFQLKESGLYYLDVLVGSGSQPVKSDTAFVFYTGYYLNGNVFDTNVGDTAAFGFPTGEGWVILGFDEGIMKMREGGIAKFLIPSYLGYGNSGWYFPAYTPVVYDVILDSLVAGPGGR